MADCSDCGMGSLGALSVKVSKALLQLPIDRRPQFPMASLPTLQPNSVLPEALDRTIYQSSYQGILSRGSFCIHDMNYIKMPL